MSKLLLLVLFTGFIFPLKAKSKDKEDLTYRYHMTLGQKSYSRILTFKKGKNSLQIKAYDDTVGQETIDLSPVTEKLISSHYEEMDKKKIHVTFDKKSKKVIVENKKKKSYQLTDKTYTSGSLYYLASSPGRNLKPQETTTIYLINVRLHDKRKMKFTYVEDKPLVLGKKLVPAKHFEMKLVGFLESLFWPYTYHFWYHAETGLIVKYEGREKNKELKTIEMI